MSILRMCHKTQCNVVEHFQRSEYLNILRLFLMIEMTSLHPCVNSTASLCTSVTDNWPGGAQVAQAFLCKLLKKL